MFMSVRKNNFFFFFFFLKSFEKTYHAAMHQYTANVGE